MEGSCIWSDEDGQTAHQRRQLKQGRFANQIEDMGRLIGKPAP